MNIKNLIYILLTMLAVMWASSCVREEILIPNDEYEEGIATRITLRIGVPEMNIATRADMGKGTDNEVKSLWVGIFSAKGRGECTFAKLYTGSEVPGELQKSHGAFAELKINTLSGPSHIVAVANPVNNYGFQYNPAGSSGELLSEMLPKTTDSEFTWEKYCSIAVRQLAVGDVNTPIGNLLMSGVYYDSRENHGQHGNETPEPAFWEEANYAAVDIRPDGELSGAVHLRRLISQVKFHIQAVDYDKDENSDGFDANKREAKRIVEVIPQGFTIVNVPYTSWLHERATLENGKPSASANSGDVVRLNSIDYTGDLIYKANYRRSAAFNGNQYINEIKRMEEVEENGETIQVQVTDHYEFDFWMLENKRRALSEGISYDDREKEVKREERTGDGDFINHNTGIYKALCSENGEDAPEIMNNSAAFVEIRCRILYTDEGLEAVRKNEEYADVQYRTAETVYTVHLGGIHNDWSDFTHRRNHRYTYYVTVMDVDRIIVEAKEDSEDRPGIEGVVSDVINPPFEMDAHYGVVNIKMSNAERTGFFRSEESSDVSVFENGKFPFRIMVYDGKENVLLMNETNYQKYPQQYWDWIELRPTSGPDVLAEYKPYWDTESGSRPEFADGRTFRLYDIQDLEKYPPFNGSKDVYDSEDQWYTLFVNEYVYETQLDEGGNNWVDYVNKPPRMCWLNTLDSSSKDTESNYIRSKYVVRQQSIQTFYSLPGNRDLDVDALGMEHINEVFGFNLRWDDVPLVFDERRIQNNNGRHNTLLYLGYNPKRDPWSLGIDDKVLWQNFMDQKSLQRISGINENSNQYKQTYQFRDAQYVVQSDGKTAPFYVPSIKTAPIKRSTDSGRSDINKDYDLRILNACMNRNRDNNGNGVIDDDEIRWYVPASSEIVDLVLGHNTLETPLMDYRMNYALNSPSESEKETEQAHQANTRFHYATSNQRVLWAEEGTSINPEVDEGSYNKSEEKWEWNLPPQQIRCVRALGTNLETDSNADLSPAFTVDVDQMPTKIYPTYYEEKNQRDYSAYALSPHQETSPLNRLSSTGFEFSKELYEFVPYSETIWIEDKRVETIPAHYECPAGYYTAGNHPNHTFLGTTEDDAKNNWWNGLQGKYEVSGGEVRSGYFLADESTYQGDDPDNCPGPDYEWWNTYFTGGVEYPAGSYAPKLDTYSEEEFADGVYFNTENQNVNFPSGYYTPDLSTFNAWGHENLMWIATFYLGRDTHPGGWYKPDISSHSYDGNLKNDSRYIYLENYPISGQRQGWYGPDETYLGINETDAKDNWWESIDKILFGPHGTFYPEETKEIDYSHAETITTGSWTDTGDADKDSEKDKLHVFILPYTFDNYKWEFDRQKFVDTHGITLRAADKVCQAEKGDGWRLPNLKEAALIKIALERAKIYRKAPAGGLNDTPNYKKQSNNGYDIGNFLTCTYREFGVDGNQSRDDDTGYYTGIYYPEVKGEAADGDYLAEDTSNILGRIACITTMWNRHFYIRCVRDLR